MWRVAYEISDVVVDTTPIHSVGHLTKRPMEFSGFDELYSKNHYDLVYVKFSSPVEI